MSQRGLHFFLKFRHGACMYGKLQQEKPLGVTDILGQQGAVWMRIAKDRERWKTLAEGYFLRWKDTA